MKTIKKSDKFNGVRYDLRGEIARVASELELDGHNILKLNLGNPASFGFATPHEMVHDIIMNMHNADGYCDSKGIFPARKAIMQYCQELKIPEVDINDIYIGNGVSELILMSMQSLLNNDDEVLVPMPDYPLWTASVAFSGGNPVHYMCNEEENWYPDINDIKSKITNKTKAIVIINPNNPTGAVYPEEILKQIIKLAEEHKLIIFADEIYDKILYDNAKHTSIASIGGDTLFVTFNGLSKNYRACGYRAGWMVLSGRKDIAKDYIDGLDIMSNMRLCANVPAQYAIQTALGGYQSITDLVKDGGRLKQQRDLCYEMLNNIDGISCVKPQGALYMFPKIDIEKFNIKNDQQFVLDFLKEKQVLIVHGSGFNWKTPDHFRIVFLPNIEDLTQALTKLDDFMATYKQK